MKVLQRGLNAFSLRKMDLIIQEVFHRVANGLEGEFMSKDKEMKKITDINMMANGFKICLMEREHNIFQMEIPFRVDS